jgi:hypothetical protein
MLCAMATIASDHASPMARVRKRKDAKAKDETKKFTCENNGCGRTFTRAEHLQRHLLNHSNGEYTCDRCRAHFKRRDLLGKNTISSLHMGNNSLGTWLSLRVLAFARVVGWSHTATFYLILFQTPSLHEQLHKPKLLIQFRHLSTVLRSIYVEHKGSPTCP